MPKLSDKYIAGFIDADGYIGPQFNKLDRKDSRPHIKRVSIDIRVGQKETQDEVLHRIQETVGGKVYRKKVNRGEPANEWRLNGKAAYSFLNRIRKHLIIKRRIAETLLDNFHKDMEVKQAEMMFAKARRERSLPLPNFPPRKWLAGYFDGDGCIHARLPKGRAAAQITLELTASDYDAEGIEIIQKAFGGSIHCWQRGKTPLVSWTLTLPPSKADQVLGYFAKHMINKREQAQFILGCAAMRHYRDGKRIKAALKHLKAHPHRLSEPKADIGKCLQSVRNIETHRVKCRRLYDENGGCLGCGSSTNEYYCDGLCRRCYDKRRLAA